MSEKKDIGYYSWPTAIILFFIALFCFEATLLTTAFDNAPTSVDEDPYEAGLKYQEVIDKKNRARAKSLSVDISFLDLESSSDTFQKKIIVDLSPKSTLHEYKTCVLEIRRSESDAFDQTLKMKSKGNGLYEALAVLPKQGLWLYALSLKDGSDEYLLEGTFTYP